MNVITGKEINSCLSCDTRCTQLACNYFTEIWEHMHMISLASRETERWCIHLGWLHIGLPQFWGIPLANSCFTEWLLFLSVYELKVLSVTSFCLQGSSAILCPWILFKAYNLRDTHPHTHMPAQMQAHTQSYYHHFLWRECCQTIFRSSAPLENLPTAQKDSKTKNEYKYFNKVQDVSDSGFSAFSVSFVT